LSIEFAKQLINFGVDRFSLGVQSLNNFELEKLGRLHDAESARKAFKILRNAGCKNISVDLMFGIPGQTKKSWEKNLKEVAEDWHPEHISFYSLSIESGTPFFKWRESKDWSWPDDDKTMDWYWLGNKILKASGYTRYEISNFSLPNFESTHNSVYWDFNKSYVGFGAAAHSFCALPVQKKRRFRNIKSVKDYIKRIETGTKFRIFSRGLNAREKLGEEIFLGLRLSKGVKIDKTHLKHFEKVIKQQVADGLIKYVDEKKEKIALTNRGIEIANVVMSEYV
jgi:oxygen-independent coproporphyrinogen-3 oxidase